MTRLPLMAYTALAVATVAAFFVTQHLKVTTPLINGSPKPYPEYIAPTGRGCGGFHRYTRYSFYLQHSPDDVAVYIVDSAGTIIRTIASGRHLPRNVRSGFNWNGRTDAGLVAPDGTYYYRVALLRQGRSYQDPHPVVVKDAAPQPRVTAVEPHLLSARGARAVIHVQGNDGRGGVVRLYRLDRAGRARLVKSFRSAFTEGTASWDGRVRRRPAAPGVYVVGLQVADEACNLGRYPPRLPSPGVPPPTPATISVG